MPTSGNRRASRTQRPVHTLKNSTILGLPINAGSFEEVAAAIFAAAGDGVAGYVCVANVHMFTLARRSKDLARVIKQAAFVTSDGMPLVWTLRRRGFADAERVYSPGLMDDLCRRAAAASMPVYLFGGTEATLSRLTEALRRRHPELRLAGAEAPPNLPPSRSSTKRSPSGLQGAARPSSSSVLGAQNKNTGWPPTPGRSAPCASASGRPSTFSPARYHRLQPGCSGPGSNGCFAW